MERVRPERVTVVGTGSWGTTLSILAARHGLATVLLARDSKEADRLNEARENARFLPGHRFPERLRATADAEQALGGCDMLLMVVPSQTMRANIRSIKPFLQGTTIVVSA